MGEQMMPAGSPYARKYKDRTAELTAGADQLRERDRERAVELGKLLVELDAAMDRAGRRAALSTLGVELQWEAALEALWGESWMRLRPRPRPAEDADPARLDELDEELVRRADELHAALRRRSLRLRRG
ncbi:MAG: hypothetical protein ACT4RN_01185 [Pseudonocardia sp.]